jgi:transposase-like protein
MLHRIREAMRTGTFRKMNGEVESDETFIGGAAKNMHAARRAEKIHGRGAVGKVAVQGILERGGTVRTFVVESVDSATLTGNVGRNVEAGSNVYTDDAGAYFGLSARFLHATVDHIREYVRGRVHTNGLENFWSLFKRSIKGTWTHIAPCHVDRYADEQSWRFNNRETHDGLRFQELLSTVVGRRLTWKQLCAVVD